MLKKKFGQYFMIMKSRNWISCAWMKIIWAPCDIEYILKEPIPISVYDWMKIKRNILILLLLITIRTQSSWNSRIRYSSLLIHRYSNMMFGNDSSYWFLYVFLKFIILWYTLSTMQHSCINNSFNYLVIHSFCVWIIVTRHVMPSISVSILLHLF
jgi:hypothetical protein